jgi:hypothetical protein
MPGNGAIADAGPKRTGAGEFAATAHGIKDCSGNPDFECRGAAGEKIALPEVDPGVGVAGLEVCAVPNEGDDRVEGGLQDLRYGGRRQVWLLAA